jgi:hypothetical protein
MISTALYLSSCGYSFCSCLLCNWPLDCKVRTWINKKSKWNIIIVIIIKMVENITYNTETEMLKNHHNTTWLHQNHSNLLKLVTAPSGSLRSMKRHSDFLNCSEHYKRIYTENNTNRMARNFRVYSENIFITRSIVWSLRLGLTG